MWPRSSYLYFCEITSKNRECQIESRKIIRPHGKVYFSHSLGLTIIVEAVASYACIFFLDYLVLIMISMLERSFIFIELIQGHDPSINYSINDKNYTLWDTTLLIVFIQSGQDLLRRSHIQKGTIGNIL